MAKILLVEDNPTELIALEMLLSKKDGHDVCTANEASLALEIFKEEKPFDIAIIDLMLISASGYSGSGFELCQTLIKQDPELPIIIITGVVNEEYLNELSRRIKNVRAFYRKPLNSVGLRKKVKDITSHVKAT